LGTTRFGLNVTVVTPVARNRGLPVSSAPDPKPPSRPRLGSDSALHLPALVLDTITTGPVVLVGALLREGRGHHRCRRSGHATSKGLVYIRGAGAADQGRLDASLITTFPRGSLIGPISPQRDHVGRPYRLAGNGPREPDLYWERVKGVPNRRSPADAQPEVQGFTDLRQEQTALLRSMGHQRPSRDRPGLGCKLGICHRYTAAASVRPPRLSGQALVSLFTE